MSETISVGRSSPFTRKAVLRFVRENKVIEPSRYLDLGGSDGLLSLEMAGILGAKKAHIVDISDEALAIAASKGLQTHNVDLNSQSLPFPDDYFDLVTMIEVLEHLVDTDHALREVHRVLRPNGYIFISTPNMASWRNRLLLLLGYYPQFAEVSFEVSVSARKCAVDERRSELGEKHLRLYTFRALKFQLAYHDFDMIAAAGAPTRFEACTGLFYRLLGYLDAILSKRVSLAPDMIVLAKKRC